MKCMFRFVLAINTGMIYSILMIQVWHSIRRYLKTSRADFNISLYLWIYVWQMVRNIDCNRCLQYLWEKNIIRSGRQTHKKKQKILHKNRKLPGQCCNYFVKSVHSSNFFFAQYSTILHHVRASSEINVISRQTRKTHHYYYFI